MNWNYLYWSLAIKNVPKYLAKEYNKSIIKLRTTSDNEDRIRAELLVKEFNKVKGSLNKRIKPSEWEEIPADYYKNKKTRQKIDREKAKIQALEASIGIDSTKSEKASVKRSQNIHIQNIKDIDMNYWKEVYKVKV